MEPLRKKVEFSKTYRLGKTGRISELSVKALKVNDTKIKLAIVVPKKVSKKAVVRNRARRRVREIIRNHSSLAVGGYFVIVNIYSDLSTLSPKELDIEVVNIFTKLGVFKSL